VSWVNQIISLVEAGGKVAWLAFVSCAVALASEYLFPELFTGLPEWAFPIIRIVAIVSLVLSIAAIFPLMTSKVSALWQCIYAPIQRRITQKKLLRLELVEVLILCKAIAQIDRTVLLKPDLAAVISLQDKGLIRFFSSGVIWGDGCSSFEVPKEVWRVLLSMGEFGGLNAEGLLRALESGSINDAPLLECLPQAHPAVRAKTEQQAT